MARRKLNENLAEQFIAGDNGSGVETKSASAEAAQKPERTVRMTLDLPESLHKEFSIYCITKGTSKADLLRSMIKTRLSRSSQ